MKKKILLVVLGLLLLVGILGGIKYLQIRKMIGAGTAPPPETVTTAEARTQSWESALTAVGSLSAVQGVTVSAEVAGKVVSIAFEAGAHVGRGDLLVRQDATIEQAQLPGAQAEVALTRANLERARELLAQGFISQAEFDSTEAAYKLAVATADGIRAAIAKKTIRAPFAGLLGIRLVNLGQPLETGDPIVSLQTLVPIFADFSLPQQDLDRIRTGQAVRLTTDALPGVTVEGRITTINPEVDEATRSIRVQATAANPDERLRPGMFVTASVVQSERREVLTIPATSVLYAPYGDSVFVVEEAEGGKEGKVLRQQFVRLGEKRGDFISVANGLKEGETVVTTGVFKLRNGQAVVVDNTLEPEFKLEPKPENN